MVSPRKSLVLLIIGALLTQSLSAGLVILNISGIADGVRSTNSPLQDGDPFQMSIIYDTSVSPDANSPSGTGYFTGAIQSITFDYNNGTIIGTASNGDIEIRNLGADYDESFSIKNTSGFLFPEFGGEAVTSLTLDFELSVDNPYEVFDPSFLPTTISQSQFIDTLAMEATVKWGSDIPPSDYFMGKITSFEISAIPEPTTTSLLMAMFGISFIAIHRYRKRNN